MGLLDDAIREHLELKRLRGADPGDVAREEQAALGPVRRGDDAQPEDQKGDTPEADPRDGSLPPSAEVASANDPSTGQETIEINMEAELAASASEDDLRLTGSEDAVPIADPAHSQAPNDESLEWEMPGEWPVESTREARSQGDIASGVGEKQGADEPVEDVLEETPDFLRDTPEQERLWFEQRPPRDFDFNE
jgi:hypothetical protein